MKFLSSIVALSLLSMVGCGRTSATSESAVSGVTTESTGLTAAQIKSVDSLVIYETPYTFNHAMYTSIHIGAARGKKILALGDIGMGGIEQNDGFRAKPFAQFLNSFPNAKKIVFLPEAEKGCIPVGYTASWQCLENEVMFVPTVKLPRATKILGKDVTQLFLSTDTLTVTGTDYVTKKKYTLSIDTKAKFVKSILAFPNVEFINPGLPYDEN